MKYLRLDSQIISSFSKCPLRCKYSLIDRLQPKDPNPAFEKGSTAHEGLEVYYNLLKEGKNFDDRVKEALIAASRYATTETSLNSKDIELCLNTLNEYFRYRRDDRIEVIGVEFYFASTLYEGKDLLGEDITILLEGKIDLVVKEQDSDIYYVYDHKTASQRRAVIPLRPQFMIYHLVTGYNVVHNLIGFQTTKTPSEKFVKTYINYRPQAIEEFRLFLIRKSLQYAKCLTIGEFPSDFSACEGQFACDYINICQWPEIAKETIEFEFRIGEVWDPKKVKNT